MHGQPIIDLLEIKELIGLLGTPFVGSKIHIVNQQMSVVMKGLGEKIYGVTLVDNAIGRDIVIVGKGVPTLSYADTVFEFFNQITIDGLSENAAEHVNRSFVRGLDESNVISDKYLVTAVLSRLLVMPAGVHTPEKAAKINYLIGKNFQGTDFVVGNALNRYRSDTMRLSKLTYSGYFAQEMTQLADRLYGVTEQNPLHDQLVDDGVQLQQLLGSITSQVQKEAIWLIIADISNKIATRYSEPPVPDDLPFPAPVVEDDDEHHRCKCGCKPKEPAPAPEPIPQPEPEPQPNEGDNDEGNTAQQ